LLFPRAVWAGSHFKNQHQMKRQIVHDENEYKQFIKTYNGRMNCYTTVYDFKSFNTKYDSYGNEISEVERIGSLPIIPCLQKAITVENPSHEARVYTVSWYRDLLAMGNRYVQNDEKEQISKSILNELEHIASMENVWLDWDSDTTEYHVRYIVDGGYHAPNCNTLISKGYCPGKCWRYT
jgi:hypothetical protein